MTRPRSRQIIRLSLWIVGSLAILLALAYLLRWPLLEGTIRREIATAVKREAGAEIEIGRLGGSLVSFIVAEDVTLAGGPLREATVRRIRVDYGFLGGGDPVVDVEGAKVVLAPGGNPDVPVGETVRRVEASVRTFHIPAAVRLRSSSLALADGRTFEIEEASLAGGRAQARFHSEEFGEISANVAAGQDGALDLEATATGGPVAFARLHRGPVRDGVQPFTLTARFEGQDLRWEGESRLDADGRLDRVEGRLTVPQGHATVWADLATGRAGLDADATVPLETDFKADVRIEARAEGPLAGPLEKWKVEEAKARAEGATFRGLPVDRVELTGARGTLARLEWSGRVARGDDSVEGKGVFRWQDAADVEGDVLVRIESLEPYRRSVPDLPEPLRLSDVALQGRLTVRGGEIAYAGDVKTGAGSWGEETWESLEGRVTFDPGDVEIDSVVVAGNRFAPKVRARGKARDAGEGAWQVEANLRTDTDRIRVEGLFLPEGDFEGKIAAEGRFDWLEAFQIELPEAWRPLKVVGAASKTDVTARLKVSVAAADGTAYKPEVAIEERDEFLTVKVAAGEIVLPESRRLAHEPIVLEVRNGRALLAPVRLSLNEPAASAKFEGSVVWDSERTRVDFKAEDGNIRHWKVEPLTAQVVVDRSSGGTSGELRWGDANGDHLIARGRIGKANDLRVDLVLRQLDRSIVGRILDESRLKGSVAAELHVTGSFQDPALVGTVSLRDAAWDELPPISLSIPVATEKGRIRLGSVEAKTPYGRLSFVGTLPVRNSKEPIDFTARLETTDFTPLDGILPTAWRPRLEGARLVVEADASGPLDGPVWGARATFTSERYEPGVPTAAVTDLRVEAVLDASGLTLESLAGRVGHGNLSAEGRWDLWRAARPLELRLEGRELLVVDRRLSRVRLTLKDGRLIWREGEGARLEGEIEVPVAILHEEFGTLGSGGVVRGATTFIEGVRLLPAQGGGAILPGAEGMDRLALDLTFLTSGECRLENSVVGVLLRAEGRIRGTGAAPVVSGRVDALGGEIRLPTEIFIAIESGRLDFPEKAGNDPQLHFVGRVGSGSDAIAVILDGPLERPNLILKSDPPRNQEELLAVVAFGQEQGAVSDAAITGFAMKLASQYTARWPSAEPTQSFLARLKPTVVEESTDSQSKPWELPEAGSRRGTVVRTEYVFSPYFSIVADSDKDANVSGDIKLRLRFK